MAKGKQTCKILKEIRKQIAAENDIKLVIEECTYQGDCRGTCPKCEAEVRYLERELEKRQRMGKAAMVAGLSVGLLGASQVALAQQPDTITPKSNYSEELMEKVAILGEIPIRYIAIDLFAHREVMDLFAPSVTKNLDIVGFNLNAPDDWNWTSENDFMELVKANTKNFYTPVFSGGESELIDFISQNLGKNADGNAYGDMEVAFTVEPNGKLSHIDIIKGVNEQLDAQVAALFKFMEWKPALWELNSGEKIPFACQCVQKLHFPMITH